jgi:hypothetical protein
VECGRSVDNVWRRVRSCFEGVCGIGRTWFWVGRMREWDETDGANGEAFGNALFSDDDFAIGVFDFRFGSGIDRGVDDLIETSIEVLVRVAAHTQ